ncbi:hypothetical protein EVAR_4408_1 [Eumeta japonica]|uniref:Uncharacterized protein n=1 Tax=Eumeta variegata TaxID=151549 RepID=A0A4C1SXP1_EUMVA|nr:hypothetical protein EVAR_4408_1 [Eumeta japonica]
MHNSLVLRGRPIIVEWERDARHRRASLSSVTHRTLPSVTPFVNGHGSTRSRPWRPVQITLSLPPEVGDDVTHPATELSKHTIDTGG